MSCVLGRSSYFDAKLKMSKTKQFYLNNVDPKIFRYIVNFLRIGELYIYNEDIVEMLNNFGIDYDKIDVDKMIDANVVSIYEPNNSSAAIVQINNSIDFLIQKRTICKIFLIVNIITHQIF